ncbi:MAG: hypothetical protein GY749_05180 [Desulfobacteraceae bacterium]|nr:hypothetical protein [Desulfobacteraceae bacterium]
MAKDSEKRIQEEIRKRVLEEEEFLPEKARKGEPARIEALSIVTYLPREDVARIAKSVRDEFDKKGSSRKWLRGFFVLLVLGSVVFGAVKYFPWLLKKIGTKDAVQSTDSEEAHTADPSFILDEPFNNSRQGWFVGGDIVYKGSIERGSYILEGLEDYQCFGDRISVKFPDQYAIELTTTWKSGSFDLYGFSLSNESGEGYVFPLKGDGLATYAILENGKPDFDEPLYTGFAKKGDGNVSNVQRVEVSRGMFRSFINGKPFKKDSLIGMDLSDIVIHCCGKQKVEFNNLKITTTDDSEVILNESFNNADAGWNPESVFSKMCSFQGGQYIFSSGTKSTCNASSIPLDIREKNYCIKLRSVWKKGEQYQYGFTLFEDDKNFIAYEIQNNRTARYIRRSSDETDNTPWKKTGHPDRKGRNTQQVVVNGDSFKYYVNDMLIEVGELKGLKIKKIEVEVCGKQTVGFDHLTIEPL